MNAPAAQAVARPALREKVVRDTALLSFASVVAQVVTMGQSILIMRLLSPHELGRWLALVLLISYGPYAHLGLEYGLTYLLPRRRADPDPARAAVLQDTAYRFGIGLAVLYAIGAFLVGVFSFHGTIVLGVAFVAATVVFEQQSLFRGRWQEAALIDFRTGSLLGIGRALVSFAVLVPLTAWLGLRGVIAGSFIVSGLFAVLWRERSGFRPGRQVDRATFAELLRTGAPILAIVLASVGLRTIDRVLVVSMLGATALAYYNVTGLGGNFVFGLLTQTGQAFTPHISREMGRGDEGRARLAAYLERPTLVLAYASVLGLVFLSFAVPFLVRLVLPHLEAGLTAFYWFVPGFFFLAIVETANGIANVMLIEQRRQRLQVLLQAGTLALEALLCAGLIYAGFGIAGAAFSSTASYAAYGLGTVALAGYLVTGSACRTVVLLGRVLLPFLYGVAAAAVLYYLGARAPAHPWLGLGMQTVACALLALPLLAAVNRELPLGQLVAPIATRLGIWRRFPPSAE